MTISSLSAVVTGKDPDHRLFGPVPDDAGGSGYGQDHPARVGFFTDTSICIGCKACEVACKEWNTLPMDDAEGRIDTLGLSGRSYDNSGMLSANTWRHVAFVEQSRPVDLPMPSVRPTGEVGAPRPLGDAPVVAPEVPASATTVEQTAPQQASTADSEIRWLMSSDVCKHCTHAACLDVCPTGALFRTEYGTVVVQDDVCNGCGYCVPACPYGVLDEREGDGRVFKCTMCYDRLTDGLMPACATACPTQSIQFGDLDELQARADARLAALQENGVGSARLYGRDQNDGVGGAGAFFLLLDEPEVYGLPPDPVVTTRDLPSMWRHAAGGAALLAGLVVSVFAGRRQ